MTPGRPAGPVAVRDAAAGLGVLSLRRPDRRAGSFLSTGDPPMTTATKMTPAEFLAMDPREHPDFVNCSDPRCESHSETGRKDAILFMPNLVELIRRIGGPAAIPDLEDKTDADGFVDFAWADEWEIMRRDGRDNAAMLKDLGSGRTHVELHRLDDWLFVEKWHPKEASLSLAFDIPADWSASAWDAPLATIDDVMMASYDLDRLAAEALDDWIGAIQKATETYIHIRRDRFVF
jgi:hypothetical protein